MSNITGYPTKKFSETQKFFILDPNTQTPSFVSGADLVSYLTPSQNYVYAEATRTTAQATDYPVGALIETAGATSAGDNFAAIYLVVAAGQGDFPMDNGNELLVIKGDEFLREQLAQSTAGDGSDLVVHTGTTDTVTQALDKRTIYVGSVAELEALSLPVGTNVYLTEEGRHGPGVIKSGVAPSDPLKGVYIPIVGGKYWVRQFGQSVALNGGTVNPLWYGAEGSWDGVVTGGFDDTPAINAALSSGFKGFELTPSSGFYQFRGSITIDESYGVETIYGAGGKIKRGNFDTLSTDTSKINLFEIRKSGVTVDGLYVDLNGLKNYDDQSGVFYYKWGPNQVRQAGAVRVSSVGTNTDNVIIKNCHFVDGDTAISSRGSYDGNPEDAPSTDNLVTNVKVINNIIEGDRGNAILGINGVLGLTVENNTVLNGFYVSIRVYSSTAQATITKNTVIVNYNNMDPSIFERSDAVDFSQPDSDAVGPRAAGIWYAKGGFGVGDSLGDALISRNSITYVGYPSGASRSEKWAAYNINTNSLATGVKVSLNKNEVSNPIRSGIIARGVGGGSASGSIVIISKNSVYDSNVYGIEAAVTQGLEVYDNEVVGYDYLSVSGSALSIRAASNSVFVGNYLSKGLSATTSGHIGIDSSVVNVKNTKFGESVNFGRFVDSSVTEELIDPSVWVPVPGLDTTGASLRFRLTVTNTTSGENQFASAIFVQDDSSGGGFVIGPVDSDPSGIISLRQNAGVPEVFLTYISGSGIRRLSFSYEAI